MLVGIFHSSLPRHQVGEVFCSQSLTCLCVLPASPRSALSSVARALAAVEPASVSCWSDCPPRFQRWRYQSMSSSRVGPQRRKDSIDSKETVNLLVNFDMWRVTLPRLPMQYQTRADPMCVYSNNGELGALLRTCRSSP
ncbi:hypothetical protein EJ03DRAFT_121629 [Teratosphaeria nubilosa]|uniref:Uncharacterized protein n=1 Tax=Teratosphaeria nubilosa TaxID=161662 RepID=A0A6G1L5X8_9PEZI|nr:hypothetical protein EJ03DRAFT_121629 [Teratosphaeria nubilosa]